ncbi:MAG: MFS transporter [Syntrophaceae bacterium]|nr:MFS transporter [Syntrophaceae bacterium]
MKFRFLMLIWLFIVVLVSFFDRVNLAVAAPMIMAEFGITPTQLGIVMAGFTIGYTILSFPAGFIVQRFSSRALLTCIIVLWSVMTGLTGIAWSFASLLVIRILFGMCEGPMFSANANLVNLWMPPRERGIAQAMWLAAIPVGVLLGNVASAAVISTYGWRSVFLVFAVLGLVVAVLSWKIVRDRPEDHPKVSPAELRSIKDAQRLHDGNNIDDEAGSTMKELMMNPWVWVLNILYFAAAMYLWGNLNWLPTYFSIARGSNLMSSGLYAAIPMISATAGLFVMGWLSDRFGKDRSLWLALTLFMAVPFTIYGVIASSLSNCLWGFSLATFFCFGSYGIIYTLPMEIFNRGDAPKVTGIMLAWSSLAGIIAPILVGFILQHTRSFDYAYYIFAGLVFIAGCLSLVLLTRERSLRILKTVKVV